MASKTHWKNLVSDSNYIGEGDFQEGEEKILTIASVNYKETVTTQEGKTTKAVVHWQEKDYKGLILNVTNSKAIAKVAKSDYMEDWVGVKVQLYIEHGIKAFGDVVSAVRVRPYPPKVQAKIKCEVDGCNNFIEPCYGMDAATWAKYSKEKLGKSCCKSCAEKIKSLSEEPKKKNAKVGAENEETKANEENVL